eukprot:Rmarinus@m.12949
MNSRFSASRLLPFVSLFLFVSYIIVFTGIGRVPVPIEDTNTVTPHANEIRFEAADGVFEIAIIADLDEMSKMDDGKRWRSVLKRGELVREPQTGKYNIIWGKDTDLTSMLNEGGRGMELSELVSFNGHIFAPDDRTGLVYDLVGIKDGGVVKVVPRYTLTYGGPNNERGFKSEWATVKDGILYIGSMGKEFTTADTGEFVHNYPLWVKTITPSGHVSSHDWTAQYTLLRKAVGAEHPGYMIHEAVCWNPSDRRWYFLPRRMSSEAYNEVDDEKMGTNLVITTDEFFQDIKSYRLGEHIPTRGYSSFKFVPGFDNEIVTIRSEEDTFVSGTQSSYIAVYNLNGDVLMPETYIGPHKYEGVEFI